MTEKKEGEWNRCYLDNNLWFEFKDVHSENDQVECYLINYYPCGKKQSEGYATYFDHPVADYEQKGEWKNYPCE